MLDLLKCCNLCPRNCGVNRLENALGFCKSGRELRVARVSLHHWEEPCISGTSGSGTVFFSNCNLRCSFCQNHKISSEGVGKEISVKRLSEIFLEQQQRGAHNINLVTPTHYVPHIVEALDIAKSNGLAIPIIYNTNSYENIDTLKTLSGYIDVYLPDLKYFDDKFSLRYSNAPNYFNYASKAIEEMFSQVGAVKFDDNGLIKKGIIIRHLMMPSLLFDSKKIMDYVYKTFGHSVYISIMNQYTPAHNSSKFPEIDRPLNSKHYDSMIDYCLSLGIKNAFIQESGTCSESFIPEFDLRGI
ncbi:radical SAM protein [Clostridium sp. CX1]|uniref:Radical SAM protein n=1 Tax=Clostridium tanneri TaxID=3037988 RepID=A0ABU4JUQ2_9CLOT|nr:MULTISPECIES: radical SAM protein [unclassified Clostridium]MCT8977513.1 radical SAM protein [Clostridium sp. CX1]MDW8801653.1 radical SAM protein [Clostridium sp. A1-XYC3]